MGTLHLFVVFSLMSAGTTPPVQVGLCISAKGMDPETVTATRAKITGDMKLLGAEVMSLPEKKGGCCTTPACLRELKRRGAAGLVEMSIFRFGSVVRINVRFFSAGLEKQVLHIRAKASAANFPASASLKGVLEKGLQSLRPLRPSSEKHSRAAKTAEPVEEPVAAPEMPLPEPRKDPVVAGVGERKSDSTWYWVGGSLAAGGAVLAGLGIYLFTGPMQSALDRRDRAYDNWLVATEPPEIESFRSEMKDQDEKASSYHTYGWVGAGVGAAMVVGGLLVVLLVPEFEETPSVRPMALRQGGGIVLQWSFQ